MLNHRMVFVLQQLVWNPSNIATYTLLLSSSLALCYSGHTCSVGWSFVSTAASFTVSNDVVPRLLS